jgi:hypothetical protein
LPFEVITTEPTKRKITFCILQHVVLSSVSIFIVFLFPKIYYLLLFQPCGGRVRDLSIKRPGESPRQTVSGGEKSTESAGRTTPYHFPVYIPNISHFIYPTVQAHKINLGRGAPLG